MFVGTTDDGAKTVWLSATQQGPFGLEAAQQSQLVDQWVQQRRRGLHVSVSPVVSSGSGGVHRLLDMSDAAKPCLVDSRNQKGGLIIPTNIIPPEPHPRPDPGPQPLPPQPHPRPDPGPQPLPPEPHPRPDPGPQPLPPEPGPHPGPQPPEPDVPTPDDAVADREGLGRPVYCVSRRRDRRTLPRDFAALPACPEDVREQLPPSIGIPLTPGRDLMQPRLWNVWAEMRISDTSDRRRGLDLDADTQAGTIGIDRAVGEDVVLGATLGISESSSSAFDGMWTTDIAGFSVGPYVAVRLSNKWAADFSLIYGHSDIEMAIAGLGADFSARAISATGGIHGDFQVEGLTVRPSLELSYTHSRISNYELSGSILGQRVTLRFTQDSSSFASLELKTELSRLFETRGGSLIAPYLELGGELEFVRPNDGHILTGSLALEEASPWTATLRAGVRALLYRSMRVEAEFGYLSLGQSDLDVKEGMLRVSFGF